MNSVKRKPLLNVAVAAVAIACVPISYAGAQQSSVIVAPRIVAPDGAIIENQAIAIEDGVIKSVADQDRISAGDATVYVIDHEGAVVCPGIIALGSSLGVRGGTIERTAVIDPSLNAFDAFDPADEDLRTALESGVTSALIMPSPVNLVNGVGAVVRTHGNRHLRLDGPLVLALGDTMLSASRNPSSQSGAAYLLRETMTASAGDDADARMRAFVKGELDAIAMCTSPQDVSAMLRVMSHSNLTPAIAHAGPTAEVIDEIAAAHAALIIAPLAPDSSLRELTAAGRAAATGIPVAWAGDGTENAQSLRMAAAIAVRYGMDPAAARRALTINAANIAGVGETVGALAAGHDADFVVFSGDPLRPDSRVLEVWIRGQRIYTRAPQQEPWSSQP